MLIQRLNPWEMPFLLRKSGNVIWKGAKPLPRNVLTVGISCEHFKLNNNALIKGVEISFMLINFSSVTFS